MTKWKQSRSKFELHTIAWLCTKRFKSQNLIEIDEERNFLIGRCLVIFFYDESSTWFVKMCGTEKKRKKTGLLIDDVLNVFAFAKI